MVFWQLTIDANDPALLARFWARARGYQPAPPAEPQTTWHTHYRARLGQEGARDQGRKEPAHLDLYPTGRDSALPLERRIEIVEAKVAELAGLDASVKRRERHDDPDNPVYHVVMNDPEGLKLVRD